MIFRIQREAVIILIILLRFISKTVAGRIVIIFLATSGQFAAANQLSSPEYRATDDSRALIEIDPGSVVREFLPDTFFGFNIRWDSFQQDLWNEKDDQVNPKIISALMPFPGALYRYPGGLVANEFMWEPATLPMKERKRRNAAGAEENRLPMFGPREYLDFVRQVKGSPLYTLNLVGEGRPSDIVEYPSEKMAASNRELAQYIKKLTPGSSVRYYQLGNELDRSHYQWPHGKYVARSLATIRAIQEVDPAARFIAFFREFNWRYRFGKQGLSRSEDLIRDVLAGLPMVDDYSLHFYYDGEKQGGKFMDIQDVVGRVNRTLSIAESVRKGKPLRVWVTEHSRHMEADRKHEQQAKIITSNLKAALSTSDFFIAMAQIPQVQGTCLHALNGVDRKVFDSDFRPRPTFLAMRVLNYGRNGAVLSTKTSSPDGSGYEGGYDVRAVALANGPDRLVVWVVNRAVTKISADIVYDRFKGQSVEMKHYYLAGKSGVDADSIGDDYSLALDPKEQALEFSDSGVAQVILPPSSVSTFVFRQKVSGMKH